MPLSVFEGVFRSQRGILQKIKIKLKNPEACLGFWSDAASAVGTAEGRVSREGSADEAFRWLKINMES